MAESILKDAGLKVTTPRLLVLEVLKDKQNRHLSAEDVYRCVLQRDESIGLATVYRILTQFEAANIVDRHDFADRHAVFELANTPHHDHIIDVDTGEVIEFVNEEIESLQEQIVKKLGYRLVDHKMVLFVQKIKK